jgi:hypothetical protein
MSDNTEAWNTGIRVKLVRGRFEGNSFENHITHFLREVFIPKKYLSINLHIGYQLSFRMPKKGFHSRFKRKNGQKDDKSIENNIFGPTFGTSSLKSSSLHAGFARPRNPRILQRFIFALSSEFRGKPRMYQVQGELAKSWQFGY